MDINELVNKVIDCAYKVGRKLYPGYLESVYQNALCIELGKAGLPYEKEVMMTVLYDGETVGQFRADIVVDGRLIVELKTVSALNESHHIQLVNYLTTTGIDDGLLINFSTKPLEIVRKYRVYKKDR